MQQVMPITDMYSEVYRIKTTGVDGYDFEKKYADPIRQIKERSYMSVKKGQKSTATVTERGSFLNDHIKLTQKNPGPGQYPSADHWPKQSKSMHRASDKKTFLDEIIQHAKHEKLPPPGAYNLFKSQKEIDEELKKLAGKKPGEKNKTSYLDEVQYASAAVPGPGNYNPHEIRRRMKTNQIKPEQWRKKAELEDKKKPVKVPDMGTYNPQPSFHLFSSPENNKKTQKSIWGTQQRFDLDPKKLKPKELGPGQYNILHEWRGKADKRPKQRDCLEAISKPVSKSVYY